MATDVIVLMANLFTGCLRHFRFSARTLLAHPESSLAALLSLAIGIGVNTAMFSVIYSSILKPTPYPQPDELVRIVEAGSLGDMTARQFDFVKHRSRSFASVAAYQVTGERRILTSTEEQWIATVTVSSDFLRTLGTSPLLGREFTAAETKPTGPLAIAISERFWRDHLNADPNVCGRAVRLEDGAHTIVGVLRADFWIPEPADALLPLRGSEVHTDEGSNTVVMARLRENVTIGQARDEARTLSGEFKQEHEIGRAHV